jgi:hypothetical protein
MKLESNKYIVDINWERGRDELFLSRISNPDDIFLISLDVDYGEYGETYAVKYTYSFCDALGDNIECIFTPDLGYNHNFDHDKLQSLEYCVPYLQEVISKDYPEYFI